MASLGWGVRVANHKGYLGNIEPQFLLTGVTPYWSNYSTEILFHVTTLIGNSPNFPDHLHKKRQILGATVVIVWAEEQQDFQPQTTMWSRCRHNIVFVVVTPLVFGLYFVKVCFFFLFFCFFIYFFNYFICAIYFSSIYFIFIFYFR